MTELAKSFEPAAIEAHWGPLWERSSAYEPRRDPSKPSFAIQLPPPNVTGTLHMGHAFNQTIMDSLTRYHRMRGFNTLWLPGTDHAGIATQIVVERQLQDKGQSRHDLGRKNFVARIWDWKHESGSTITNQMRRLGDSVSWQHEYFTMDEKLSTVVTDTFVKLYDDGLIYRGKRMVSWDPVLKSAVSFRSRPYSFRVSSGSFERSSVPAQRSTIGPSGRSIPTSSTPALSSRRTISFRPARSCWIMNRCSASPSAPTMQTAWSSFAQSTPAHTRAPVASSATIIIVSSLLEQWGNTRWSRDTAAGRSLIGALWRTAL